MFCQIKTALFNMYIYICIYPQSSISVSNRYHGIAAQTQKINGLWIPCCSTFTIIISNLCTKITTKTLEAHQTPSPLLITSHDPICNKNGNGFPVSCFLLQICPICKAWVRSGSVLQVHGTPGLFHFANEDFLNQGD